MALPTAQLGSMASLNVPSYIPSQVVRKEPKLWEAALAQLLTQAAGGVAGRGIENVMSRDYAPEFGMEKAGTLEKFISGPRANERMMGKKVDVASQLALSELGAKDAQMGREYNTQQENLRAVDKRAGDLEMSTLRQRGDNAQMKFQGEQSAAQRQLQLMLAQINQTGDETRAMEQGTRDVNQSNERREDKQRTARSDALEQQVKIQKLMEEIKGAQRMGRFMDNAVDGKAKEGKAAGVNPNVAKFGAGTKAPVRPVDPQMQEVFNRLTTPSAPINEQQLRQSLSAPNAMSPEEMILLLLSQQNPTR
jgi:hypothetical protein